MKKMRSLDRTAIIVMLVCCCSWGFQQVGAKLAMGELGPLTQAAIRSVGGTILIGVWSLWREPEAFRRDGTLGAGLLVGVLFTLEFLAVFLGLSMTSASHSVLFLYTSPFFICLGLWLFMPEERLRPLQWTGMAMSFAGVALALGASSGDDPRVSLAGDLVVLLAGAAWGVTTVVIKKSKLRSAPVSKVLLYQLVVSAILLPLAAWWTGESLPASLSGVALVSITYQTVWVVTVTFLIWFWLIATYRAGELSAFTFLTPVIGVLAGWLVLGDSLAPGFVAAVTLVAAGIVLVNWPARRLPQSASS